MKTSMLKVFFVLMVMGACKKDHPQNDPVTYGASFVLTISTDKAVYKPGDNMVFTLNKAATGNIKIRYRQLAETIAESVLNGNSWTWKAPAADYTGYMVDLYETSDGKERVLASIGVDVSSDWGRFPRYGFLTRFGQLSNDEMGNVIGNLSRHHINGLQYYDWLYKHHWPLGGTAAAPLSSWKEISNQEVSLATLKAYISAGHDRNMKSMFYNLAFGALSDAAADGVPEEWYAFKDNRHSQKDKHDLPQPFFTSDIFVTDAGNTNWQNYLVARNNDVYAVLDFDGYHVDALGDRGGLYNYNGIAIDQAASFKPFLQAMKAAAPSRRLLMNAVNQYGQQGSIAQAPVDFLYTEVWGPNENFSDLATIIRDNDQFGGGTKRTVLAAYLNYDYSDNTGYFNTPGVLMADAVIFAFGGSHLELGEHVLSKEYFPHANLQMSDELKTAITAYYDFLVAYENLLRDGGTFNATLLSCTNEAMILNNWPPALGQVSVVGKEFSNRQVIQLINFKGANSLQWRDTRATQAKPVKIEDASLRLTSSRTVKKIWMASPDSNSGVAVNLSFTQSGNIITFTLPSLQYWDMVVVDYV